MAVVAARSPNDSVIMRDLAGVPADSDASARLCSGGRHSLVAWQRLGYFSGSCAWLAVSAVGCSENYALAATAMCGEPLGGG